METSRDRTFANVLTQCPNTDEPFNCPVLVRDLSIARESSGEVFMDNPIRANDSDQQRIARIMSGARTSLVGRLCDDCPKNT